MKALLLDSVVLALIALALFKFVGCTSAGVQVPARPTTAPIRFPVPEPGPQPGPCPVCPRGEDYQASVGGNTAPDGTPIQCDLPGDQHCANISSRGQGCCTQTSINHSARWQNVPALIDFHKWVREKGIPGGGHPKAIDERIPRCAKDRGYPVPDYIQIEGTDVEMLKLACKTGRMPGVTYSRSPTGRYGGQRVAHMVSLAHADEKGNFCVLDNNYPGADKYEWMSEAEFKKAYTGGRQGWSVILLSPPPPPVPKN